MSDITLPTIDDSQRDALLGIKRKCRHYIDTDQRGNIFCTPGTYGLAGKASQAILKQLISKIHRTEFYTWVFERELASSTNMFEREVFGFVGWAYENPQATNFTIDTNKWALPTRFFSDLTLLEMAFSGQHGFDLPLKSNGEGLEAEIVRQLGFGGMDDTYQSPECPHGYRANCPHGCY